MSISHLEEGFIVGNILGDGHLSKRQTCLEICHTLPQLSYLKFKINFANRLGYNTKRYKNTVKRTNVGLYTYCKGYINRYNIKKFYKYRLVDLLAKLDEFGLLIWWLDDGSLTINEKRNGSVSRFGYLNTQNFTYDENVLISTILYDKFGIETRIHVDSKSGLANQNHFRLYINATNFRRFIDLVREFIPWVPKKMYYKLNMKYVINRRKNSEEFAKHYNF